MPTSRTKESSGVGSYYQHLKDTNTQVIQVLVSGLLDDLQVRSDQLQESDTSWGIEPHLSTDWNNNQKLIQNIQGVADDGSLFDLFMIDSGGNEIEMLIHTDNQINNTPRNKIQHI